MCSIDMICSVTFNTSRWYNDTLFVTIRSIARTKDKQLSFLGNFAGINDFIIIIKALEKS